MTMPTRLPALLALAAAVLWFSTTDTDAHAAYESSSPAFAEVLDKSPSEISIRFTQELFRREGGNELWVESARGGDISQYLLPIVISNEDRHVMRAELDFELRPGRYLVSWANLSAEDGDTDSGSIPFYVATEPTMSEIEVDRTMAQELLIIYPGDEPEEPEAVETVALSTPAVVRADQDDDASIGAGPIIWLAAGGLAALFVVGAMGFRLGSRRRHDP